LAYIAQRHLKVAKIGSDKITEYQPGDIIPDFGEWPEVPRRAHLNMNYVVKDDSVPNVAPKVAKIAKNIDKDESLPPPTQEVAHSSDDSDDDRLFACAKCTGKRFATSRALSNHITLAHRKG
jgi:hypothetical protein